MTMLKDARMGELINAMQELNTKQVQTAIQAETLLKTVLDCVDKDDMAALKRIAPMLRKEAQL